MCKNQGGITKAPFTTQTVLTDNGKSFTERFTRAGERKPSGRHPFDQECQAHGIEHRQIKTGKPQTDGMVERFNGRISDVLVTWRYTSGEDLEQTLKRYAWLYNHHCPQKALHHQSPITAMKEWQSSLLNYFPNRWTITLDPKINDCEKMSLCEPGSLNIGGC